MRPPKYIYVVLDNNGNFQSASDLECDVEFDAAYISAGESIIRRYKLEPVSIYVQKVARRIKRRSLRKRHV